MSLPRRSFAAAGLQSKFRLSKIFEDIFKNEDPLQRIGGYYDVTVTDGAKSIAGVEAINSNDPVGVLKQHVPDASGTDITFHAFSDPSSPMEMSYRKEYILGNGSVVNDAPIMFYPAGHFDGFLTPDGAGGFTASGVPDIYQALGDFNVPEGHLIQSYTLALAGVQMLHELGVTASGIQNLVANAGAEDQADVLGLPVPVEPGILVITASIDAVTRLPDVHAYVNGTEISTGFVPDQDLAVPEGEGLNFSDFLEMLTMPCWGTQKLLLISRVLSESEIVQVTERMQKTLRVKP